MIRVRNLVKKFGELTAVNDVSFEVAAGEIFAFLGPNGAGKTTTIKMLTTLMQAYRAGRSRSTGWIPDEAATRYGSVSESCFRTRASTRI